MRQVVLLELIGTILPTATGWSARAARAAEVDRTPARSSMEEKADVPPVAAIWSTALVAGDLVEAFAICGPGRTTARAADVRGRERRRRRAGDGGLTGAIRVRS